MSDTVRREDLERPLLCFYWGYDSNDMAMVTDAYTEDVVLLATPDPFLGDAFEGETRVEGREALVARHARNRAGFLERAEVPRHTYVNFMVDRVEGTEAEVRAYYLMYVQSAELGTVFIGLSPLHLRLALERDGKWRIRHHHVVCAHMRGYERLPTAEHYIVSD